MNKWMWLLVAGGLVGTSRACDVCAIYAAQEALQGHQGWHAGASAQFSHFGTLREEGRKTDNEGDEQLDSLNSQFIGGYRVNDVFGFQLNMPYLYRDFDRPGEAEGTRDQGTEQGLGDLVLLGSLRLWQWQQGEQAITVHGLAGLKLPTGDSDRLFEAAEEDAPAESDHHHGGLHDHDLALGSGSWDGLFGASLAARCGRWFLHGQGQYMLRTEGDFDYTYADDITWSAQPGYSLWLADAGSLGLGLEVSGEHKGKDQRGDEVEHDTAIDAIYLGPALTATRGQDLHGELALALPVQQENSGTQLVPDYRVRAAVTARF